MKSWGHKITVSIYVAGQDQARAVRAAEKAAQAAGSALGPYYPYPVEFAGASVDSVSERPSDQGKGARS